MPAPDLVLSQRTRIARLVVNAKRAGYGLYLLAMVLFGVGYAFGYTELTTTVIMVALVLGSLVLAPAIVIGYGVKAAEREERRARQAESARRERQAEEVRRRRQGKVAGAARPAPAAEPTSG